MLTEIEPDNLVFSPLAQMDKLTFRKNDWLLKLIMVHVCFFFKFSSGQVKYLFTCSDGQAEVNSLSYTLL